MAENSYSDSTNSTNLLIQRQTHHSEDETMYLGQWNKQNDFKEGWGMQVEPDGSLYQGFWKNGMYDGPGRLIKTDSSVYEGYWKKNIKHGKGIETFKDGATYDGDFLEGNKTGFGIWYYADGSTYQGEVQDNKRHGDGQFNDVQGDSYDGNWVRTSLISTLSFKISSFYIDRRQEARTWQVKAKRWDNI